MIETSTGGETGQASSRMEHVRHAVSDAAHRARERASHAAERATERATHAIDQQKGRVASRLSRIATSIRDASQCFADNEEADLGQYVEMAADRLDEVGDYIQEHPFDELRHEGAMFLRRHPELGLAGAFIGGLLIGRFLRTSSTSQYGEAAGYGDQEWDEEENSGSAAYSGPSFGAAGAARASYGPGRGVITPLGEATSSGPTAPGHAMARGRGERNGGSASGSAAPSSGAQSSSRADTGGESCA